MAAAAGIGLMGWPRSLAAQMPAKPIGIQVGAVSFLDEGTDKVLDTLAKLSSVDTLFLRRSLMAEASVAPAPRHAATRSRKQEYDDVPTGRRKRRRRRTMSTRQ